MRSVRSHVVALLAVLLALAAGIALGSGPLQSEIETRTASAPDPDVPEDADDQVEALRSGTDYSDDFALSVSSRLVRDTLADRTVTVLVLPGAAPASVAGVGDMVARAGGRVVSEVRVDPRLLDVANRQLVGELGTQMVESAGGAVRVPPTAGDYERLGALMARALVTQERAGVEPDAAAKGIQAGLEAAGLLTLGEGAGTRGSLLLAVGGPAYGSEDEREGAGTIVSSLLVEAARTARAVVLAGPTGSGQADGLVGLLRAEPEARPAVSSVDGVDRVAGRIDTVLALAVDVTGPSGHFGVDAASRPRCC